MNDEALQPGASPSGVKQPPPTQRITKKALFIVWMVGAVVLSALYYSMVLSQSDGSEVVVEEKENNLLGSAQQEAQTMMGYDKPPDLVIPTTQPAVIPKEPEEEKPPPQPEVAKKEAPPPPTKDPLSELEKARLQQLAELQKLKTRLFLEAVASNSAAGEAGLNRQQQAKDQNFEERKREEELNQLRLQGEHRAALAQKTANEPQSNADLQRIEGLLSRIAANTGQAAPQTLQPHQGGQGRNTRPAGTAQAVPRQRPATGQSAPRLLAQRPTQTAATEKNQPRKTASSPVPQAQESQKLTPGSPEHIAALKQKAPAGTFVEMEKTYGYSSEGKRKQLTAYDLRVGTLIPATMISGINSDLPGEVIAQVSQNVRDSTTGRYILIPQGTRLIGQYQNNVSFGQSRVNVVWNRLQFPDGKTLALGGMRGADQGGYTGFSDKVNNHYWRTFGGATLLAIISGGVQSSQSDNNRVNTTNGETFADALGQQYAEIGRELVERNLNVSPTLEIRPGYRFNVFVNKDLVLEPYYVNKVSYGQ